VTGRVHPALAACAACIACALPVPAQAQCEPLLSAQGPARPQALPLNLCELSLAHAGKTQGALVALQLTPAATQRWREALALDAPLGTDLLSASAWVQGESALGAGLPRGPLVYAYSARLIRGLSWRWEARQGRLLLIRQAPLNAAPALPVCPAVRGRQLRLWTAPLELRPGQVFAPVAELVGGTAPPEHLPDSCAQHWSAEAPALMVDPALSLGMVSPQARPGQGFVLRLRIAGQTAEGPVTIVAP